MSSDESEKEKYIKESIEHAERFLKDLNEKMKSLK